DGIRDRNVTGVQTCALPISVYLPPHINLLNSRYLELVDLCVEANKQVSIASHDETIHKQVIERGYLQNSYVEAELLYGIRPDLKIGRASCREWVRISEGRIW